MFARRWLNVGCIQVPSTDGGKHASLISCRAITAPSRPTPRRAADPVGFGRRGFSLQRRRSAVGPPQPVAAINASLKNITFGARQPPVWQGASLVDADLKQRYLYRPVATVRVSTGEYNTNGIKVNSPYDTIALSVPYNRRGFFCMWPRDRRA